MALERKEKKVRNFGSVYHPRFKTELVELVHAMTHTTKEKLRRMAKRALYGWYYRLRAER